jgi:hypothetical protein
MTLFTTRLVLVVPAEQQALANAACAQLGFGPRIFEAPVWSDSSLQGVKATHYWCSWAMQPQNEALVLAALATAGVDVVVQKVDRPDPATAKPRPDEVLEVQGLKDWRGAAQGRDGVLSAGQTSTRSGGAALPPGN